MKVSLKGWWSRRITREHRFIYRCAGKGQNQNIAISQCRYHDWARFDQRRGVVRQSERLKGDGDDMEKLKLHSPDLTKGNIEKLADLFPQCVTEVRNENGELVRQIDFDRLRQELSGRIIEGPSERYQLTWPGKREALLTANAPIAKTLRPCREESVDFDTTRNLFIEGDNLDALKLLQETYLNKIKVIYIDPPYNTGNDFIYDDNFAECAHEFLKRSNQKDEAGNRLIVNTEANGRFHSDWLSMMYPRLRLARNLLRDDGVIFISIDSNELHNLRKVCDEIFGESCHKNTIAVRRGIKNVQAQFDDVSSLSQGHEYLLLYSKSSATRLPKLSFAHDERKPGKWDTFWRGTDRPTMRYELFGIRPSSGQWRWEEGRTKEAIKNYEKYLRIHASDMTLDEWYLDNLTATNTKLNFVRKNEEGTVQYYVPPSEGKLLSDNWMDLTISGNETDEFDTEKSVELLKRIAGWTLCEATGEIIVDFFSGSATTAHAVIEINAERNSTHRFIMVQLPASVDEKSIAFKAGLKTIAEIGKERIRRAGAKIKANNPLLKSDVGFRVLKVDSSNMQDVYYTPDTTRQETLLDAVDNIKHDRTAEDLLFHVMLDWGVYLHLPIFRETIAEKTVYFVNQDRPDLAACFDRGVTEALVKQIAARHPLRAVFRDSGFSSDSVKINVEQIFKLLSPTTDVKVI